MLDSSRRTKWTGKVARMGEMGNEYKNLSENIGVSGRIILEWILRKIEWESEDWILLVQYKGE
jgi:hypothetical protein